VPPALNSITASGVTAPNSSVPGSIPSASGVTPPNSGVASSVPSSSGVTPPGSSPGTATGVTPPGGGGAVTPLDYRDGWTGNCVRSWWGGEGSGCAYGDRISLEREQAAREQEVKNATNEAEKVTALEALAKAKASLADLKSGENSLKELTDLINSPKYQKYSPVGKLHILQAIDIGLSLGTLGEKGLTDLKNALSSFVGIEMVNGRPIFVLSSGAGAPNAVTSFLTGNNSSNQAGAGFVLQGTSTVLGFVPVVGDFLSVTGAILGYDPITGEKLEGVWRWVGLLGVIGLGEVSTLGRGARAAAEVSLAMRRGKGLSFLASEGRSIGKAMNPEKFARIKNAFERAGGLVNQGAETDAFLKWRGAQAAALGSDTVLFGANPTVSQVFEEFMHTAQFRTGRYNQWVEKFGQSGATMQAEMEVLERLIKNANAWGIPADEVEESVRLLQGYQDDWTRFLSGGR
jgi:Pre-toxin TG